MTLGLKVNESEKIDDCNPYDGCVDECEVYIFCEKWRDPWFFDGEPFQKRVFTDHVKTGAVCWIESPEGKHKCTRPPNHTEPHESAGHKKNNLEETAFARWASREGGG